MEYPGAKQRISDGAAALDKKEADGQGDEIVGVVQRVDKLGKQHGEDENRFGVGHTGGEPQGKPLR